MLGGIDDLQNVVDDFANRDKPIERVVMTPSAFEADAQPEAVLMRARKLGLAVSRLPSLEESRDTPRLAPVAVEDLLLRPSVKIDYARLEALLKGKSIVVTGGGGSIGFEMCDRVTTFGAARLLVIENSEPALHAAMETLSAKVTQHRGRRPHRRHPRSRADLPADRPSSSPTWCSTPPRLKHVPILERDWGEGVKTNIFGSVNVADAARAAGAEAMVMISTDKAIEPVSMLGLTKRFAEMYCQAMDRELADRRRRQAADAADLGAVRQRAGVERLGGAEVQGADRGRRTGDGDASGHGALLHDDPRSLRSGHHRRDPCARSRSTRTPRCSC